MIATRRPVKSTPSCGQDPVWKVRPEKFSCPGSDGTLATDSGPVASSR